MSTSTASEPFVRSSLDEADSAQSGATQRILLQILRSLHPIQRLENLSVVHQVLQSLPSTLEALQNCRPRPDDL